jgi:hypothetical protein
VVLQLDAEDLEALRARVRKAQSRASASPYAGAEELLGASRNAVQICRLASEGTLGSHVIALLDLLVNEAMHGATDGFEAALAAAEAVGAEVVAADRNDRVTAQRMDFAQKRAMTSSHRVDGEVLQKMGPAVVSAVHTSRLESVRRHGCFMKQEDVSSAANKLIFEAAVMGRVRNENLATVRACLGSNHDRYRVAELLLAAPAVRMAGGTPAQAAAAAAEAADPGVLNASPVKFAERELLFARAMQSAPGRDVVGIFAPKHVAGIARAWAGASSAEADALAAEYTRPPPPAFPRLEAMNTKLEAFMPSKTVQFALIGLTAASYPLEKAIKMRSVRPVRNAALAVAALAALPVAAVSLTQRAVVALLRADAELRTLDQLRLDLAKKDASAGLRMAA